MHLASNNVSKLMRFWLGVSDQWEGDSEITIKHLALILYYGSSRNI